MTGEIAIDAVESRIVKAPFERDTRQAAVLKAPWLARVFAHFSLIPWRAAQREERRPPAQAGDRRSVFADTEATWKVS